MALPKVHSVVDAEVSRVLARGKEGSSYGRAPRLTFEDASSNGIPQLVQVDQVEWPPAITEILGTVQSHSEMGYFAEMQRVWMTVDNKLLLWNYATGRDLCIFGGFSQLIISISEPAKPKPGVFRDCITRIIAIASCDVVTLIGVQQKIEENGSMSVASDTRLVDLEFSIAAPCMIVKFAVDPVTGSIFAAGADGQVYHLHYERTASVLYPRISLVAASSTNILRSSYNYIVSTIKSTLRGAAPAPLVDICYDSRNQMVYALDAANAVVGYERHGANLRLSFKYTYDVSKRSSISSPSPLVALHVGSASNTLVAVTETGERVMLKFSIDTWTSTSSLQESGDALPSPLHPSHIITRSWYSHGLFVSSSVEGAGGGRSSDAVTFVTDTQGEASVGTRAPLRPNEIMRIEHICEVDPPSPFALFVQQVMCAPRLVLLIHRKGISVYMRLRPVDILRIILELPKEERERQLAAFSVRCSTTEYCVMLTQIASKSSSAKPSSQRSKGAAHSLLTEPSSDAARQAVDILRRYSQPSVEERLRGTTRDITVNYSQVAVGALTYLARLVVPVWNQTPLLLNENGLTSVNLQKLRVAETAIRKFITFLEHSQGDLWHEVSAASASGASAFLRDVAWSQTSAKIEVPQTSLFVANTDSRIMQAAHIQSILEFAKGTTQVITFFLVCGRFERRVIAHFATELSASKEYSTDPKASIGRLVMNAGDARKIARFIAKAVVQSSSVCPKEVSLLFEEMERDSPFLFDASDREEYETILQFSRMLEHSNLSESSIHQVLARTAGIAGSLYRNGALAHLISRLQQMNLHREALSLYLFAAAQSDNSQDEWERVMISVTSTLERLYEFDRNMFVAVVGGPQTPGSMWYVRPQDARTHLRLLAWMAERRNDESLTQALHSTMVMVPSPELEGFLCKNIHELGLVYAEYLGKIKFDFRAAVEVCSRLLADPLLHINASERLSYRLQCARKAVELALEVNSSQRTGAEHAMQILLLQAKLASVIERFIFSGSSALNDVVADGSGRTQRDLATQHLQLLQSDIISQEKIFVLALNYEVMEEAVEVAMESLCLNRTFDPMVVSRLLQRVVTTDKSLSDVSRLVQRFGRRVGFPVVSLILLAEQIQHSRTPNGSTAVPKMLVDAGLEFDTIFSAYNEIIERRAVQLTTALGIEGRLPDSFLLYSQAYLLQLADGRVGGIARYSSTVRQSLDRLSRSATQLERTTVLNAVSGFLDRL